MELVPRVRYSQTTLESRLDYFFDALTQFFKPVEGMMSEDSVRAAIDGNQTKVHKEDVMDALRTLVSQAEMSNKKRVLSDLKKLFSSR